MATDGPLWGGKNLSTYLYNKTKKLARLFFYKTSEQIIFISYKKTQQTRICSQLLNIFILPPYNKCFLLQEN